MPGTKRTRCTRTPKLKQRIEWHRKHRRLCACREVPNPCCCTSKKSQSRQRIRAVRRSALVKLKVHCDRNDHWDGSHFLFVGRRETVAANRFERLLIQPNT